MIVSPQTKWKGKADMFGYIFIIEGIWESRRNMKLSEMIGARSNVMIFLRDVCLFRSAPLESRTFLFILRSSSARGKFEL